MHLPVTSGTLPSPTRGDHVDGREAVRLRCIPSPGDAVAEQHRWEIDEIEEGVAAIIEDGDRMHHVPLWMLPAGVAAGAVLTLRVTQSSPRSADVTLSVDRVEAPSTPGRGRKRPRSRSDRGGDIIL